MGFRKQGKGGIYFKETEEVSATFEGTSKHTKCWGNGTQENKFSIFGEQASSFQTNKTSFSRSPFPPPPPPGHLAQSVTCLVTDAKLTADPGVASSIPALSHTFVEIDHERISTVILLPSAESFMKGCCQLQAKVC